MRTVAIIGARGGSKGLPNKNLLTLAGKPLVAHTIQHALDAGVCEAVILSTENPTIAEVARSYGARVVPRPSELAEDMVPAEPVIKHALEVYEQEQGVVCDVVVYLQTTDVFRRPEWIRACVERLAADPALDSVFSAHRTHKNFWRHTAEGWIRVWKPTLSYPPRQTQERLYREDTGVACATRAAFVRAGQRIGPRVDIIPNDEFATSIDIHTEFDLWLAEQVMTRWAAERAQGSREKPATNAQTWLGSDVKSWSQSIRNGYVRAFLIFALHETGVFARLRERGPQTSLELANACGLDAHLLDGVLNFLLHADEVLEKSDGRFALTLVGREWLFHDSVLAMSFGAVGAYSPLLYNLVPTLRREMRYGVDFVRPGDLLAKGSFYTGKGNYPWVVGELARLGVKVVADLGCGSADVLIGFCGLDPELRGVGIDIAPGAIEEATRRVQSAGLSGRIRLQLADLTKPESFRHAVDEVGAFNAIMVLHEFLRDGDDAVVAMLQAMKTAFPERYLIVGEFDRLSDVEFQNLPYPDRIHPLFYQYVIHPLTWQGLPITKAHWLRLFDRAGLRVLAVKDDFPFRLVEFVLQF